MSLTNAIMDLVLMGLLVAALWYGARLHKQLKALRAGQEQFAKVVHELDTAAIRAHNSLKDLRQDADESQDLLHGRILAARELMQKLDAQVVRAERVQRELDSGVSAAAAIQTLAARPVVSPTPAEPVRSAESFVRRRPFDRDVVQEDAPLTLGLRNRAPLAPAEADGDETELLEKVQMSELVVANLNEMIRTLNLPSRQPQKAVLSMEEDLFGSSPKK